MKRQIQYLLFLTVCIPIFMQGDCEDNSHDDRECSGRSHLTVRPVFHSASPELVAGFRYDRENVREDDGWHGAFQFAIFGGKSRNSKQLARYFLPFGKESIVVGEQSEQPSSTNTDFPDIAASHFGIF